MRLIIIEVVGTELVVQPNVWEVLRLNVVADGNESRRGSYGIS